MGATSNRLTGFVQTINGSSNTSVSYGYNANGDMVTDGLRSYTYDAEGRLAASTTGATDTSPTTRYAHNALGQRVFKTEPLYPPSQGNAADPGFMQSLIAFFTKLWSPTTTQAEQLGYAYVYDEQGMLIAEVGSGGTNSAGQSQYIYLPTGNGPMPIAAIVNGATYAIHSDHLNTPRKLTNANGQAVWQWGYSAFGEDKPTTARNRFANTETTPNPGTTNISEVKFNLRYPGQYADEESGLYYNYFRSYDTRTGRYSQPDPIGLGGGWNRFGYVDANPLSYVDPDGLDPIGQAIGGAIGTWGGRALGAAGGSFLGPAGTAIGGMVGGAIGNKVVGAVGSAIGDMCTAQSSNPCGERTYHRVTSPSQSGDDLAKQVASGMICGGGRRQAGGGMSPIPSAKAFPGPLPPGQSGIEFKTSVCPSSDGPITYWHLGSPGVIPVGDLACVPVTITRTAP